MTSGRGRIVGSTFDPYGETDPAHVAYHEHNRRRGRPGGQLRVRIRYRDLCSPWLYLLFTSASELESIIEGTGWALARVIDGGGSYVAVLEKD